MKLYQAPYLESIISEIPAMTQTGLAATPQCSTEECVGHTLGYGCRINGATSEDTVEVCYTYPGTSCSDLTPPCQIIVNGQVATCGGDKGIQPLADRSNGQPFACEDGAIADSNCTGPTLWSFACLIPNGDPCNTQQQEQALQLELRCDNQDFDVCVLIT